MAGTTDIVADTDTDGFPEADTEMDTEMNTEMDPEADGFAALDVVLDVWRRPNEVGSSQTWSESCRDWYRPKRAK